MSELYTIEVTGELPLEIEADLLVDIDNQWTNNVENDRYHKIKVFEVHEDDSYLTSYVLQIEYITHWQGENCISEVWEVDDLEAVKDNLHEYYCIEYLVGYPDGDRYHEKQQKLQDRLIFNWKNLRVQALKELGFKRETRGRKTIGDKPRVNVNLRIDPVIKERAKEQGLNLSQILEKALEQEFKAIEQESA